MLFVDYGNTELCSKMVDVTAELMAVRVVGINCQLDQVQWVGVEAKPIVSCDFQSSCQEYLIDFQN